MSDPRTLDIAREFGFNMMSFANNHTFDWGYGGLISTLETLKKTDLVHTGVGNPRICKDRGILERYAQMSAPYGTKITVNEQGIGIVEVGK